MNGQVVFDGKQLEIGDVVFIRVQARPFLEVAAATGSWTNHVGIVVTTDGPEPWIAESAFPRVRIGPLSRFLARSERGRVAVMRLPRPWSEREIAALRAAVREREGRWYDTGFNFDSGRQFCSRFVHEVVQQATGIAVGRVQTFFELLTERPDIRLGFWRIWYCGRIPWQRRTITPASLLDSHAMRRVFDGHAVAGPAPALAA